MEAVLVIGAAGVAIAVYFIPSFGAGRRNHRNANAILALNLLLGWTFVGWAIALVWALTANTAPANVESRASSRSSDGDHVL
jgi:hypothetical protein